MEKEELIELLEEMKDRYNLTEIREFFDEIGELLDSEDILELADAVEEARS